MEKRYLTIPLGLSFDDLTQAAIVATRKENSGNIVYDRETDREISNQELQKIVLSLKPKTEKPKDQQLGLFDRKFEILPSLLENIQN
jgi:hypothetical protein